MPQRTLVHFVQLVPTRRVHLRESRLHMDSAVHDHLIQLCALAAVEQDSKKLLVLFEEINRLFEERAAIQSEATSLSGGL